MVLIICVVVVIIFVVVVICVVVVIIFVVVVFIFVVFLSVFSSDTRVAEPVRQGNRRLVSTMLCLVVLRNNWLLLFLCLVPLLPRYLPILNRQTGV